MELDVNLTKEEDESWGFCLIGGVDFKMPLTVVKVLTDSPAEKAGLQNGDTVARINDTIASDLSHDDAGLIVNTAKTKLTLGVQRGLYDPVLDEYEPIYEQIDQDGFDQPSQPTEVHDTFQIQQFLDPQSGVCNPPKELKTDTYDLSERSLTASPFVPQTKPYRPFSTEPLDVPPLEDPIILNPNYHDEFKKTAEDNVDYEVLGLGSNLNDDLKFKLPISKQYDPEWQKKESARLSKEKKEVKIESKTENSKIDIVDLIQTKAEVKHDIEFTKKIEQEINLDNIEMTASSIVDESIVKAMSVAEQIKNEIDVELNYSTVTSSEIKESKTVKDSTEVSTLMTSAVSEITSENEKISSEMKVSDIQDETSTVTFDEVKTERNEINEEFENSENIKQQKVSITETKSTKYIEKLDTLNEKDQLIDVRKKSIKQEVNEVIEEGNVRRKSMIFDHEVVSSDKSKETQSMKTGEDSQVKIEKVQKTLDNNDKDIQRKSVKQVESKKSAEGKISEARTTSRSQAEKCYKIGLQTIPNIRGTLHSSCHYNLLLKTFFIHLTDVMVALSRFILSEPVFSKSDESHEIKQNLISTKDTSESTNISYEHKIDKEIVEKREETKSAKIFNDCNNIKKEESKAIDKNNVKEIGSEKKELKVQNEVKKETIREMKVQEKNSQKNEVEEETLKTAKQEEKIIKQETTDYTDNLAIKEKTHKPALSGSEMAQLCEKKSEELTVKMDAVISEFENKAGIEDTLEVKERKRRSRSRSKVDEEVTNANDSLEWLSKKESVTSQEITELKMSKKEFSNKVESAARKKIDREETSEITTTKPEGKQMYVAIVESHVFTNKGAIFEEHTTDISETKVVKCAEMVNMAMESNEVANSENVTMKRSEIKEERAKAVVEESHVVATKHETEIQQIEEMSHEKREVKNDMHFEKATEVDIESTQEVVVQQVVKPIVEVQEIMKVNLCEDIQKISTKEESFEVAKQESVKIQRVNESIEEKYDGVEISKTHIELAKEEEITQVKEECVEIQEVVDEAIEEKYDATQICEGHIELAKEEETKLVKEEQAVELDVSAEIKIERPVIVDIEPKIESAALKIVKEQVIEVQPSPEILETEQTKVLKIEETVDLSKDIIAESVSKFVDISESSSLESFTDIRSKMIAQESSFTAKSMVEESSFASQSVVQESSFTVKSVNTTSDVKKLSLRTDLAEEKSLERQSSAQSDENDNIDTPTPATIPPTPLTDEYVFKLQIPLPKNIIPVPLDPAPEVDEDPHIVKKKLVPYIETTLESPVIYDPPLPTPPEDKVQSPVYTKPGLKGGAARYYIKEEILEIGRKSSLLASAIDETIKSIEEYKEQVGMETNKEVQESNMEYNSSKTVHSLSKKESSASFKQISVSNSKIEIEEEWSKVDKQIEDNNRSLTELSQTASEKTEEISDKIQNSTVETKSEVISESVTEISDMKYSERSEIKNSSVDIKEINKVKTELEPETETSSNAGTVAIITKEAVENLNVSKKAHEYISENNEVGKVESKNEEVSKHNETEADNIRNSFVLSEVSKHAVETVPENNTYTYSTEITAEKADPMSGYRPVKFNPEEFGKYPRPQAVEINIQAQETGRAYMTPTGELLGTVQGFVDGLEDATVDEDIAKELGKPGMTEDKIAALISGESEMLREAHVMGLTRVLTSHMTRSTDDSSVDFKKIKPIIESLKDSEVLKALNDDLTKTKQEKKKEERKWTKFLQKPQRPVPRAKFGYYGYVDQEEEVVETPYKVKIVKQPKPKIAPDYKPENFDTGPLPWEERALNEPPPPPIEAEDPILVPEEQPEFLEAVDPLPESEVPDLEETGIPLPPPKPVEEITVEPPTPLPAEVIEEIPEEEEELEEPVIEQQEKQKEEMENRIAEQLMNSVQNMVDPNATLEQQLAQMRAQLAALAQLPEVIQQTLEMVTKQLSQLTQQESVTIEASHQSQQVSTIEETQRMVMNGQEEVMVTQNTDPIIEESPEDIQKEADVTVANNVTIEEQVETTNISQEEMEKLKKEEAEMLEEQRRIEKQKKAMMEQMKQEQESRQLKQRPTPRVGKPKPVFGPPNPEDRPLVLTGGRKWRGPKDVYDEQMLTETLKAQAELIQGKALGASFESVHLPYDARINFMKYEKPPVSLDHLQHSEVYKLIHNMEQTPVKRVEMLTPVIAEADYREKCRSISPCVGRMTKEQHLDIPQQVQP